MKTRNALRSALFVGVCSLIVGFLGTPTQRPATTQHVGLQLADIIILPPRTGGQASAQPA